MTLFVLSIHGIGIIAWSVCILTGWLMHCIQTSVLLLWLIAVALLALSKAQDSSQDSQFIVKVLSLDLFGYSISNVIVDNEYNISASSDPLQRPILSKRV